MNGDEADFRTRALVLLYREGCPHREAVATLAEEFRMDRQRVDAELRSMGRWAHSEEIDLPEDSLIRALAMFRSQVYELVDAANEAEGAAEDGRALALRREAVEGAKSHARLAHHVGLTLTEFEAEKIDFPDTAGGEADAQ